MTGSHGTELQVTHTLYRIACVLSENSDFHEKTKRVVDTMAEVARADSVSLRVPDDRAGGLRLAASVCAGDMPPSPDTLAFGQGLAGQA